MVRMLISALFHLAANAVGLLCAAWLLEGMTLDASGFVVAVAIFTVAEVVLGPMIRKVAATKAEVLVGGTALVVTLLGLLVTSLVSDGLRIEGVTTWVLATSIVWLASLLAALLLPVVLVRRARDERRAGAAS